MRNIKTKLLFRKSLYTILIAIKILQWQFRLVRGRIVRIVVYRNVGIIGAGKLFLRKMMVKILRNLYTVLNLFILLHLHRTSISLLVCILIMHMPLLWAIIRRNITLSLLLMALILSGRNLPTLARHLKISFWSFLT